MAGSDSPSTSPSTSPSPTLEPTGSGTTPEPTGSGKPTIEPATGIELREKTSSIRVPEGWRRVEPLVSYQSGAVGPRGAGGIDLFDDKALYPGSSLKVRVHARIKTRPKGAKYARLDNVMLGDSVAFHLQWSTEDSPRIDHVVETERNGRLITVNFSIEPKVLRRDPNLVASVLATFRWV